MNRQVEVLLGLVAVDLYQTQNIRVLCQEEDNQLSLPSRPLDRFTPEATAADLIQFAACLDPSWLKIKLVCIDDRPLNDQLSLVYGCMVPEAIDLPNPLFKWVNLLEILRHNTNMPQNHVYLLNKVATNV